VVPSGKIARRRPGFQRLQHVLVGQVGGLAATAFDEHRVCAPGQPADQGPLSDLALCDEGGGQQGVDDENVDEGYMVADQQSALHAGEEGARRFDTDAQQPDQLVRPDLFQSLSQRFACMAEQYCDLQRAEQQVQAHQEQAEARGEDRHLFRLGRACYSGITSRVVRDG
jgi:hypothetical protein